MDLFEKLNEDLKKSKSILLTTHVNPDGDAIGSQLALFYMLREMGKEVKMINHSETPYTLAFLDRGKRIEKYVPQRHDEFILNVDLIVFLDLNMPGRVVSMQEICQKSKAKKWVIDHHTEPADFADEYLLTAEACATGEIIYDFWEKEKPVEMNYDIAEALYTAIMTDTGSFRFDRTTPRIHRIIADLMEYGIRPDFVYEQVFDQGEIGRLKLLGSALETLALNSTGEICYMIISRKTLEQTNTDEADIEGFVNYTMSVRGVKVGMLFYELENGFKVSFRSKGNIPVNKIAAEFGGGGHLNAAGCRIDGGDFKTMIDVIIKTAEKYLK